MAITGMPRVGPHVQIVGNLVTYRTKWSPIKGLGVVATTVKIGTAQASRCIPLTGIEAGSQGKRENDKYVVY